MPSRSTVLRVALVIAVVFVIAAFFLAGGHRELSFEALRARLDQLNAIVAEHFALALIVFAMTYVAVAALSLPVAVPLSMIGGALFGRWMGTGVVSIAATLGATLAFLGSRFLFRDWVERRFGERLKPIHEGVARDGGWYLLTLRLVPLVPFTLINLGMGLTRMRVRTYAAVSWLGMLPGTFLFVNAGTEVAKIQNPGDVLSWPILVSFTVLGLVPVVIRRVVQQIGKKRKASQRA